jgi:hypothetical protein
MFEPGCRVCWNDGSMDFQAGWTNDFVKHSDRIGIAASPTTVLNKQNAS